jgi:hypothetical protein
MPEILLRKISDKHYFCFLNFAFCLFVMLDLLSNKFGLIFIILVIFFLWLAYLTFLFQTYVKDRQKILGEAREKGIDFVLQTINREIKKQKLDIKELYRLSDEFAELGAKSITNIGLVRYNPFNDTGGDLSFSIAFLDSRGNGLVISGLHTREGTRIFSKPIKEGASPYQLSKEEGEAIGKALKS